MRKAADAFRSIGEVSQLVGVPPHVLRYWETQFPQLTPVKRADGRRYYRPEDLHLAAGICELLREEGMTTRGAARVIARDKGAEVRARGLARLPERFRGAAGATTKDDTTPIAQSEAEADETMTRKQNASGATRTPTARRGTTPPPSARPETAGVEPEQEAELPADARQAVPAANAIPDDQEKTVAEQADESASSATPSPAREVATQSPRESTGAAPEAAEPSADSAGVSHAGDDSREAVSGAGPVAPAAAEPAPPSIPSDFPAPESAAAAVLPPQGAAGDVAPDRPAPIAGDLPLFPGLAPAAPPPGIWLPRLAAAAAALHEMPVPRRPTARMQHLRDRIAALIDADH